MKNSLKWKPAVTVYPSDHIVSSLAREVGDYGFKPEYDSVKHVNMRFIMSNEYMRLWFKERDAYQKENYSKQERAQSETHMKRGFVQRMMTNPKAQMKELPFIQLKRFQNIVAKVDNRRTGDNTKICAKYKKTVEPIKFERYKPNCKNKKSTKMGQKRDETSKENLDECKDVTNAEICICQLACG